MDTNTNLAKTLTPVAGAGTGTGLAVGADNDVLQIIGVIIGALSVIWPIIQSMRAKKSAQ